LLLTAEIVNPWTVRVSAFFFLRIRLNFSDNSVRGDVQYLRFCSHGSSRIYPMQSEFQARTGPICNTGE